MGTYKELKVWQVNQECIKESLSLFEKLPSSYPIQHIVKQLFRAISSVGANVAEGQDSYEGKEFIRYWNISIRSAIELDHWIATLQNLGTAVDKLEKLRYANVEVIKMLKGLKHSIENKH